MNTPDVGAGLVPAQPNIGQPKWLPLQNRKKIKWF